MTDIVCIALHFLTLIVGLRIHIFTYLHFIVQCTCCDFSLAYPHLLPLPIVGQKQSACPSSAEATFLGRRHSTRPSKRNIVNYSRARDYIDPLAQGLSHPQKHCEVFRVHSQRSYIITTISRLSPHDHTDFLHSTRKPTINSATKQAPSQRKRVYSISRTRI